MVRPKATETPAREKILRTASDLFFKQGYHQTGTHQIIEEAGVSRPTFYAHFPSKEDLAVAYVRASAAASLGRIGGISDRFTDPVEGYLSFFESISRFLVETDFRGCNFANIAREFPGRDSRIRKEVEAFERRYREALGAAVRRLFEAEPDRFTSRNLTVEDATDRYYLLLDGCVTACANYHDPWPLRAAGKAIRDLVGIEESVASKG